MQSDLVTPFDSFANDVLWFALDRVGKVGAFYSAGGRVPAGFDVANQDLLEAAMSNMPDLGLPIPLERMLTSYLFQAFTRGTTLASVEPNLTRWSRKGLFTYDGGQPGSQTYQALYWPEVPLKSVHLPSELVDRLKRCSFSGIFGESSMIDVDCFVGGKSER